MGVSYRSGETACSRHGVMEMALNATGVETFACACFDGFMGDFCEIALDCSHLNFCNGHGVCVRGGTCCCDPHWNRNEDCSVGFEW
eukprot:JP439590.1.p1 GENE.JP439590.1~~JP439590.1.p1  ORF type:complete len:86 (+),score=19.27 JP439590.1:1-258(+)